MKLFLILSIFLLPCLSIAQPFLVTGLPTDGSVITQTQLEITTNPGPSQTIQVVSGLAIIQGSDFIFYDLKTLPAGKYSFRGRWAEATGIWSEYNGPFPLGKPAPPGGLRVKP